jgi:hypothetical protein
VDNINACIEYVLPWGDTVRTSGVYSYTYAASGSSCVTIVTKNVTINQPVQQSIQVAACDQYVLPWGGTVSVSGTYVHTYIGGAVTGCDSTLTVNLTMNSSTSSSFTDISCDNYLLPWGTTVFASGNYSHTYSTVAGCDSVVTASIVINQSATVEFTDSACYTYTLPWGTSVTTSGDYYYNYTTTAGCDSSVTAHIIIKQCFDTLNLKLFVQGYYQGGGLMSAKSFNAGVSGAGNTDVENVQIELRNSVNGNLVGTAHAGMLHTDGTVSVVIPSVSGSYYIVVKGSQQGAASGTNISNILETWSASPVAMGGTVNYDFTTAASKAYGSNQVNVGSGVYALFNGDINRDGSIESTDYLLLENDIISIVFGYSATDLSGDGVVESDDYLLMENAILQVIFAQKPF